MEDKSMLLKYLILIAESLTQTNFDLFKLKTISKSADAFSSIIQKTIVFTAVLIMIISLNVGLALWIGELLGTLYLGFFAVAAFYVLVVLILHFVPSLIKSPMNNYLISKMLNNKKDEKELT